MRRTNINAVLRMVKQFLDGKMDAISFWLGQHRTNELLSTKRHPDHEK